MSSPPSSDDFGIGEKDLSVPRVAVDMAGAGGDLAGQSGDGGGLDTSGPVITYVQPLPANIVGGVLDIVVTISDPSGVDPSTTEVVLANDPTNDTVQLLSTGATDTYHALFDLGRLGKGIVFLNLSVRADDKLGNHSERGEDVILDNAPPLLTMDAAIQMRVSKLDGTNIECSQAFGPLGPTTIDPTNGPEVAFDGAVMKQIMGLRARIEDTGNHAPGQRVNYIADIDESTVTLFAVGSTPTLPVLAVDTDGDNKCDEVNPSLVPTSGTVVMSNQALALAMAPLLDTGAANFHADGSLPPAGCFEVGTAGEPVPGPLCTKAGTGLTFVIPSAGKDKPIYSVPPIRDPDACVGFPIDAANHLPEGPACVITRAVDKAGNHMISYPIHICIDLGGGMCNGFVPSATACTGALDNKGMVIPGSTCAEGTTFPKSGEIRYLPAF